MRLGVNGRWHGFRLTAAARIIRQSRVIQHLCRFPAELVQQAIWHEQRIRQIYRNVARIVNGLSQLRHAILQAVEGFFCIVRHLKQTVEGMRDADAVFTGHGQDQLLFPAT